MKHLKNLKVDFDTDGFCVAKNLFQDDEILELDKKLQEFLENKSEILKGRDINRTPNNSINTMHDIDKHENYFSNFAKKEKIVSLSKLLLNSEPEFRKCEMFAKPAKVGMASPMHQDNFLWAVKNNNGLTFWLALDNCNEFNGGLTYLKGSHKYGLLEHESSFAPGTSQKIIKRILKKIESECEVITPKLNPGDVLIHHCLMVHGSGLNKSEKNRRGFTIQFKDKKSIYDHDLLDNYEKKLNQQMKMREQI
jgi:phytanoyl-CoA hydroxylase